MPAGKPPSSRFPTLSWTGVVNANPAVGCTGDVTEATRRRPFRGWLRSLRRSRELVLAPSLPDGDAVRVVKAIDQVLRQPETNEQRAAAERVVVAYERLDAGGRRRFLELLATDFGADSAAVDRAVDRVRAARTSSERRTAERELRRAVVPRYAAWLHVITGLPRGVSILVDLRADLLALQSTDPGLGMLDDELAGHLSTLFDVGLLDLRQITWDSPASVLERLMATEAVHAIAGWDDLRHRLDGDQRCYAFFHPALEYEPIVFVEIALTHGLADNLPELLNRADAVDDPDSAIFYSITSAQPGLAGVHLGNELIKQVVDALRVENDRLKTFATLSPLPGFRAWLRSQLEGGGLTLAETESLAPDARALIDLADRSWISDPARWERLRPGVLSAAARYLTSMRDGRALDPVANFHLSNGASLERINWMANPAEYGIDESLGLMVNYRYDRSKIAGNAAAYLTEGEVSSSSQVRNLVKTTKL
jgi:malonyl-CoA decarboxylase